MSNLALILSVLACIGVAGAAAYLWLKPTRIFLSQSAEQLMQRSSFFRNLGTIERAQLSRVLQPILLPQKALLFAEGSEDDCAYIVIEGRVDIYRAGPKGQMKLASLGPGQIIGEIALLRGEARSASAVAGSNVYLLRIRRAAFSEVSSISPMIRRELLRSYMLRSLDNCMRQTGVMSYAGITAEKWISQGSEEARHEGQIQVPPCVHFLFLYNGELAIAGQRTSSPALLSVKPGQIVDLLSHSDITWLSGSSFVNKRAA